MAPSHFCKHPVHFLGQSFSPEILFSLGLELKGISVCVVKAIILVQDS